MYHFTLAQSPSSIPMRANICRLPEVMYAKPRSTQKRQANAPSRIAKNVGLRDDPGFKILEKKDSSLSSLLDAMVAVTRRVNRQADVTK